MRGLATFFLSVLILIGLFFQDLLPDFKTEKEPIKTKLEYAGEQSVKIPDDAVSNWIGKDIKSFNKRWGEPERIDPSAYGYEWYIYASKNTKGYLQAGVEDGEIVTLYVIGSDVNTKPFTIGASSNDIIQNYPVESDITIHDGEDFFKFELSEEEVMIRPLVDLGNDVWVQLYFDKFTNKLSSVRYLTADILLKQRPYSIVYRGDLPSLPNITEAKQKEIDDSEQQEIYELSNVIRMNYNLNPLEWDNAASEVAFLHSKDMADQNYFSHKSKDGRTLSDRLEDGNVTFLQAGENIAANYTDGIAAVQGWMNSEGHRKALLNKEYTHLGVGVYKKYYTQNFIVPAQ
ncbi:CAP domain-containing protein [Bacillus sp. NEB1478]|uniref:CAP domain-containing protein n=1 Tax=Bacillus sp. NEB1478 TaxID=3073816 RepID=UPI002873112B|nr:CAP domain-containing protein [Bacillus sp. NEB1478]WNB90520.1 CAP domain-containing protein [Bacillus sp. NEB1478]